MDPVSSDQGVLILYSSWMKICLGHVFALRLTILPVLRSLEAEHISPQMARQTPKLPLHLHLLVYIQPEC
jgi:hypothetical protein